MWPQAVCPSTGQLCSLTTSRAFEGSIFAVLAGMGCKMLSLGGSVPTPLPDKCSHRNALKAGKAGASIVAFVGFGCLTGCVHTNGLSPVWVRRCRSMCAFLARKSQPCMGQVSTVGCLERDGCCGARFVAVSLAVSALAAIVSAIKGGIGADHTPTAGVEDAPACTPT